eukprot:5822210-Amphidinium_carterae.1
MALDVSYRLALTHVMVLDAGDMCSSEEAQAGATIKTTPVPVHQINRPYPAGPAPVVLYPQQRSGEMTTFVCPSPFLAATKEDVLWQLRTQTYVEFLDQHS